MTEITQERRKYKRFSAVPIKIYLKKDNEFKYTEMLDISIGGLQVRTSRDFHIYEEYDCQIELPLKDGKDLIYSKVMVWRIEADEAYMTEKKRHVAFRFQNIQEYDQLMISEFLASFEEDVPYV